MGSLAKGFFAESCGNSAESSQKLRFIAPGKGAEIPRKVRGNLRKILCNDLFPNDPISELLKETFSGLPGLLPKRLLAPISYQFRGNPGIRGLYQASRVTKLKLQKLWPQPWPSNPCFFWFPLFFFDCLALTILDVSPFSFRFSFFQRIYWGCFKK